MNEEHPKNEADQLAPRDPRDVKQKQFIIKKSSVKFERQPREPAA